MAFPSARRAWSVGAEEGRARGIQPEYLYVQEKAETYVSAFALSTERGMLDKPIDASRNGPNRREPSHRGNPSRHDSPNHLANPTRHKVHTTRRQIPHIPRAHTPAAHKRRVPGKLLPERYTREPGACRPVLGRCKPGSAPCKPARAPACRPGPARRRPGPGKPAPGLPPRAQARAAAIRCPGQIGCPLAKPKRLQEEQH